MSYIPRFGDRNAKTKVKFSEAVDVNLLSEEELRKHITAIQDRIERIVSYSPTLLGAGQTTVDEVAKGLEKANAELSEARVAYEDRFGAGEQPLTSELVVS